MRGPGKGEISAFCQRLGSKVDRLGASKDRRDVIKSEVGQRQLAADILIAQTFRLCDGRKGICATVYKVVEPLMGLGSHDSLDNRQIGLAGLAVFIHLLDHQTHLNATALDPSWSKAADLWSLSANEWLQIKGNSNLVAGQIDTLRDVQRIDFAMNYCIEHIREPVCGQSGFSCSIGEHGIVTLTDASHSSAKSTPSSGHRNRAVPALKRRCSKFLVVRSFEQMALMVEGVECRGMEIEEALR